MDVYLVCLYIVLTVGCLWKNKIISCSWDIFFFYSTYNLGVCKRNTITSVIASSILNVFNRKILQRAIIILLSIGHSGWYFDALYIVFQNARTLIVTNLFLMPLNENTIIFIFHFL